MGEVIARTIPVPQLFNFKLSTFNFFGDAEAESTTRLQITPPCASNEHTCLARHSRKRRSDRAETQQRLRPPSLCSGKDQTPPNRDPPATPLQPLSGATPA